MTSKMTTATSPLGAYQGVRGDGCEIYRGIRYARAPIGDLRFRPPAPVDPWDGVYDATQFGASAPQFGMPPELDVPLELPVEPTDEDCLFLNVYTPAADGQSRPVLFWIHGGGYIQGSGRIYDGSVYCREHDLVVVSINYRLGPLGFLHVGHLDPEAPESINNGILDQICALEWVRDNIAGFGGDPGRVTIAGESAGGTAVALLLGCPRAEGLFHGAIAQSPNCDFVPCGDEHAEFTNEVIRKLGGDPAANGLDALRSATTDALLMAAMVVQEADPGFVDYRPGEVTNTTPAFDATLIPAHPGDALAKRVANVPVMVGTCRHEGTLFAGMIAPRKINEDELLTLFAEQGVDAELAMAAYEAFATGSTPTQKLIYANTEVMFRNSALRTIEGQVASGSPAFVYLFTHETDHYGGTLGATHGLELPFQWDLIREGEFWSRFAGSAAPAELGRQLRAYWAAFVRTGNPNAEGLPAWEPYELTRRSTLLLDREIRLEDDPDGETRRVWTS